jgi:hypothetical protein
MATLQNILRFRGALYKRVAAEEAFIDSDAGDLSSNLSEQAQAEVDKAIAAIGGHRTGQKIGGPTKLRDGGEPWSTEVTVKVAKLQPETTMSTAFPYSTIEWCGWVEARLVNGKLRISATGTLALDGACFDDQARILGKDDLVVGSWDGESWTWRRDVREQ